jgi:ADP-heptose:LPS heptosyltransferase
MGWGDELMASAQAKALNLKTGKKVAICYWDMRARWHEAWANNPRIYQHGERVPADPKTPRVVNAPGTRPYIERKTETRWFWKDHKCEPGEIYFNDQELQRAKMLVDGQQFVLIEPNLKERASPNKNWGWQRWSALVGIMRSAGLRVFQVGPIGTSVVEGAELLITPSFRAGCAVLALAKAAVLHEGGLHHAAAAVGVPAVVIYGGFISPDQTGYAMHRNLFTAREPCGFRTPCSHCNTAMAKIEPAAVMQELGELL